MLNNVISRVNEDPCGLQCGFVVPCRNMCRLSRKIVPSHRHFGFVLPILIRAEPAIAWR
jgi:hypothetical protein